MDVKEEVRTLVDEIKKREGDPEYDASAKVQISEKIEKPEAELAEEVKWKAWKDESGEARWKAEVDASAKLQEKIEKTEAFLAEENKKLDESREANWRAVSEAAEKIQGLNWDFTEIDSRSKKDQITVEQIKELVGAFTRGGVAGRTYPGHQSKVALEIPYVPSIYWQVRGNDYYADKGPEEEEYLRWLVSIGLGPKDEICDIGSGYGRCYVDLEKYGLLTNKFFTMFDFVDSFRDKCLFHTGIRPLYWDGHHIPVPDNSYDLVISSSVFLHVPPEDIEQMFTEHVRVSKRYLYVASYSGDGKDLASHCFGHDYNRLFEQNHLDLFDHRDFARGQRTNWWLRKKE